MCQIPRNTIVTIHCGPSIIQTSPFHRVIFLLFAVTCSLCGAYFCFCTGIASFRSDPFLPLHIPLINLTSHNSCWVGILFFIAKKNKESPVLQGQHQSSDHPNGNSTKMIKFVQAQEIMRNLVWLKIRIQIKQIGAKSEKCVLD